MHEQLVTTTPRPAAPWVGWAVALHGSGTVLLWAGVTVDDAALVAVGTVVLAAGIGCGTVGAARLAQHLDRLGGVLYRPGGGPVVTSDDERARQAHARRLRAAGNDDSAATRDHTEPTKVDTAPTNDDTPPGRT